jgi:hypothetical protein
MARQLSLNPYDGVRVAYRVRVYCHASFAGRVCQHEPTHPFTLPEEFSSLRIANDRGDEFTAALEDDEVEWEVIDTAGNLVC